ncbi:neurocalcin homolog isoform X2 [Lineus longissimus]|uniref:neurocalcin homolog isoform X2 n=1 Tax=Lineus longissimus TaxID=88925 RepID=UPI00315C8EFB
MIWRKCTPSEDDTSACCKDEEGKVRYGSTKEDKCQLTTSNEKEMDDCADGKLNEAVTSDNTHDVLDELVRLTKYTLEELREWHKMFMEQNPDGKMRKEGIEDLFLQMFPKGNAAKFARNVFRTYDVDGDGQICFKEFILGISVTDRGTVEEKLEWAFAIYDKDGSGYIDKEETLDILLSVQEMQGKTNKKAAEKVVKRVFNKFDVDKDGKLSKKEFLDGCAKDQSLVSHLKWAGTEN